MNKSFFERSTNISAKVVCDSIYQGKRITTLEVEFPRFILAEVNTHRMISKNCSSSRAINIKAMRDNIIANMATPIYWGITQGGMQATRELSEEEACLALYEWKAVGSETANFAYEYSQEHNLHKQIANRMSEPFQMVKAVWTATEWDNFFNLRLHEDSQPELCMLAYKVYKAMEESTPVELLVDDWHLPYVERKRNLAGEMRYRSNGKTLCLEEAMKVSASCSAQVSYRKTDESLEKANKIFDMLIKADVLHASPFEHLATPIHNTMKSEPKLGEWRFDTFLPRSEDWGKGVTHINKNSEMCSGNLVGWKSYRHTKLKNNTCWKFDFDERMKEFE